jgi:hypothetical protein
MHIIPPKRPSRQKPIIALMIDDLCGTTDIITLYPERFAISRREIACELRALIDNWIYEKSAA